MILASTESESVLGYKALAALGIGGEMISSMESMY